MIEPINLAEKFALFGEYWSPRVIGEVQDCYVKLVKMRGTFIWHKHEDEDELFLVIKGRLLMELRDGERRVNEGEMIIIPRGVEHRPIAEEECHVLLFEPKSTVNTGDVLHEFMQEEPRWL